MTYTTHDGKTLEQVLADVEQVVESRENPPYGDNRTCAMQLGSCQLVQRMVQHFEDRAKLTAFGISNPINLEYLNYSMWLERDIVKWIGPTGTVFYYIM